MKGKVVISSFWTRFFSWGKADAVTIFPFIFVREKLCCDDPILVNHERIHIRQALEMLVLPFYIWYVIEFLYRLIKYRNFQQAYLNISFEREAYTQDKNLLYLKKRPYWSFLKYM
ncbi:MAG TPA: hypothetical protein PKA53_02725 [Sphingobacterium sp.]|nr:hypothetical protein [Sphingobacterium sp.]